MELYWVSLSPSTSGFHVGIMEFECQAQLSLQHNRSRSVGINSPSNQGIRNRGTNPLFTFVKFLHSNWRQCDPKSQSYGGCSLRCFHDQWGVCLQKCWCQDSSKLMFFDLNDSVISKQNDTIEPVVKSYIIWEPWMPNRIPWTVKNLAGYLPHILKCKESVKLSPSTLQQKAYSYQRRNESWINSWVVGTTIRARTSDKWQAVQDQIHDKIWICVSFLFLSAYPRLCLWNAHNLELLFVFLHFFLGSSSLKRRKSVVSRDLVRIQYQKVKKFSENNLLIVPCCCNSSPKSHRRPFHFPWSATFDV